MPTVQNAAKTMRNLKRGANGAAPYAYWTNTLRTLEFWSVANRSINGGEAVKIDLKPGTTFYHDGYSALVTIQGGSGSMYLTDQPFVSTSDGLDQWYSSQTTTDKGRNGGGTPGSSETISGLLVPDAVHYIYASPLDDAGNPDYYVYVDTVQPERGVNPYTRDISIGSFKTVPRTVAAAKTGRPIMDLETRVRNLEGVLRAGRTAGQQQSDYRIADLVARFYAIELKLNGGATPAVGSNATYTEDQFMLYGEGGNA